MLSGEFLTKLTIWITLAGYAVGVFVFAWSRNRASWDKIARLAWTAACLALLAHVAAALHFYHGWNQASAYQETARQTAEVFGLNWGGGLFINYALLIFWIVDVLWWWRGLDLYRRRPAPLVVMWHAFLLFIFFNGTVVFEKGLMRWLGISLCLGLCVVWWLTSKNNSQRKIGDNNNLNVVES